MKLPAALRAIHIIPRPLLLLFLLAGIMALGPSPGYAQDRRWDFSPMPDKVSWGPSLTIGQARLSLVPTVQAGTHSNRIGPSLSLTVPLSELAALLDPLVAYFQASYTYDLTPLGIPERTHQVLGVSGLALGFGSSAVQKGLPFVTRRRHTFFYQHEIFWDSEDTGQLSGAAGYIYSSPSFSTRIIFENDILAFQGFDAYRTGALEWSVHFPYRGHPVGLGLGFIAWTGETPRPNDMTRDDVYDLSNRHGGAYSHGILYGAIFFRRFRLSVGWDSEKSRDVIQNNLHYLINDGKVPPLDRKSRFFLLLSLNTLYSLY
ncbi:hypothetical protein KKF84_07175 [Myxococcota bacterium]|nr:hypothetical protein [Myxococcota bacterium]MBU1535084.1 hypothetical protein [Myxococcota bacterium]